MRKYVRTKLPIDIQPVEILKKTYLIFGNYKVYEICSSNFVKFQENIICLAPYPGAVNNKYYFQFEFNNIKNKTIQLRIPKVGDNRVGYQLGTDLFPCGSEIYIGNTTFPYPVFIKSENTDVHLYITNCTFQNNGYNNSDRLYYHPSNGTLEISSKVNYLLYSEVKVFTILEGNTLELPETFDIINPVQTVTNVDIINNTSFFTIKWGYRSSEVSVYTIGFLDSIIFNRPLILLYGNAKFNISSPLTVPVILQKEDNISSTIINTTFCNGVTFDLTGKGEIILDDCSIYTPPIISSNVYVVTSIVMPFNLKSHVTFKGNKNIMMTGYGNSYLWNVIKCDGNVKFTNAELNNVLANIVSNVSINNVNLILNKGMNYNFSSVPTNLLANKLYLYDSNLPYNLSGINNILNIRLLTDHSRIYHILKNSLGFKIAFNTSISSIDNAVINNLTANCGIILYANSSISVNTLTIYNNKAPYALTTLGSGNIIINNLSITANGKNFWKNSSDVILSQFVYNALPNSYDLTQNEYLSQTINLISGTYKFLSNQKVLLNGNANIINSTFNGGLQIFSPLCISNSTIQNEKGTYLIETQNNNVILINNNLYLKSYNYVTENVTVVHDINNVYNLIASNNFISISDRYNRSLEQNGNVNLVSENGIYHLNGLVNSDSDIIVPFKLSVSSSNATIVSTEFSNGIKLGYVCNNVNFVNCNFKSTFDSNNSYGLINFSNSIISSSSSLFSNYRLFGQTDIKCTLTSSDITLLNLEPNFVTSVYVENGTYNIQNVLRKMTYYTLNTILNLTASNEQTIISKGNTSILGGNISGNSSNYALKIYGNNQTINCINPLSLSNNKDILYLEGNSLNVNTNSLLLEHCNIPITANISNNGSLNINNTVFNNCNYQLIYWTGNVTNTKPLLTNNNYIGLSWLPGNVYTLTKTNGILNLNEDCNFVSSNNVYDKMFNLKVIANASVSHMNVNLSFDQAPNILPNVTNVNDLFNSSVVSEGFIGGLNSDLSKSYSSNSSLLNFSLNFKKDTLNYYIGTLHSNLIISDSDNNLYPKFSYVMKENTNYKPNFSLSNITANIDVYNDTSQLITYKLTTANSRPLILNASIYPINSEATYKCSYIPDIKPTINGFNLNGTNELCINNIIGLVQNNSWKIEMDLSINNLASVFNILEVNDLLVYVNNRNIIVSYNNNDIISSSVSSVNHIGISYKPNYIESDIWLNNGIIDFYVNDTYINESQNYDYANIVIDNLILGEGMLGQISNVQISCGNGNIFYNEMKDTSQVLSCQEVPYFTNDQNILFGVNGNYTYYRPNMMFCETRNYLDQENCIDIKGATSNWQTQVYTLGAFFTHDSNALPICTTNLIVNNSSSPNAFPLGKVGTYNTIWSGFSGNMYIVNHNGNLNVTNTDYTFDFYYTIKMANASNISIYTEPNDDIEFSFSRNVINFETRTVGNKIDNNNTATILVQARVLNSGNKICGDSYSGNIILEPLSGISSIGKFTFEIPYLVELSVGNVTSLSSTLDPYLLSPYAVTKNSSIYLYVSLLSIANANVNVELSTHCDLNLPYNLSKSQLTIPLGSNSATTHSIVSIEEDHKVWGNSRIEVLCANINLDGKAITSSDATIIIPYNEIGRREIIINETTYYDSNINSNEIVTSSFIGNVFTEHDIMSKQTRRPLTLSTSSIPHSIDGSSSNLEGTLTFRLLSSGVEKDISDQILVYDSSSMYGNIVGSQIISSETVYIDVSEVNFRNTTQSNGRLINIYANLVPSSTDYDSIGNVLIYTLDYGNATVDTGSAQDNIILGNWKLITGPDGKLLVQYKNNSVDNWVTKAYFDV